MYFENSPSSFQFVVFHFYFWVIYFTLSLTFFYRMRKCKYLDRYVMGLVLQCNSQRVCCIIIRKPCFLAQFNVFKFLQYINRWWVWTLAALSVPWLIELHLLIFLKGIYQYRQNCKLVISFGQYVQAYMKHVGPFL